MPLKLLGDSGPCRSISSSSQMTWLVRSVSAVLMPVTPAMFCIQATLSGVLNSPESMLRIDVNMAA